MKRASWDTFVSEGILWFVNRMLHVFGWAIVLVEDDTGAIVDVYPARTGVLGFSLEDDVAHRRAFIASIDPSIGEVKTQASDLDAEDQGVVAKVEALTVED